MKTKIFFLILVSLVSSLLLGGCATGLTPSSWPGVVTDGKTAYIASAAHVYAVSLEDGSEVWRFPEKADAKKSFFAAPVLTPDGQLIVGGYDYILYSLNPQNGQVNWQFEAARDRWVGSVLVANDLIYAPNADYNLYAFNLKGEFQWKFATRQAIWATPVTDGQRVYLGSLDRKVYAVDARTGKLVWDKTLTGAILGSPVLGGDGQLYVMTFGGTVFALDTANGEQLWKFAAGNFVWSAPVLSNGELYFGDSNGNFYALNASTGAKDWSLQPSSPILGAPLVAGDHILFGTEAGNLYAVDTQGQNTWNLTVSGKLYGAPVAGSDLILVAPVEGQSLLIALDQTGTQKWAFTPVKK
ncbi:MAG: PQQ-binding-like beta-propeller repeat protein [Chloroflexota bacterium]